MVSFSDLTTEDDGLCPSMYSFHSSPEEKNKLLYSLTQYGIETTVDRGAKKDRIRAWIENSIIDEEEEEGDEAEGDTDQEERLGILDNETGPIGERTDRGPIQTTKLNRTAGKTMDDKQKRREIRDAMINKRNSSIYIPPVDPRIPLELQRLSRSETQLTNITPSAPNKFFEKFSSRIASDIKTENHVTNLDDKKSNKTKHEAQKANTTTQTSSHSNESNNSAAQSDDSTLVNYQTQNSHYEQANHNEERTKVSLPLKQIQSTQIYTKERRTNSSKQKKQSIATTQTAEPYVQNGRYEYQKAQERRDEKLYSNKYQRLLKDRYDLYDNREEKSSSSISNSTGRSVSK